MSTAWTGFFSTHAQLLSKSNLLSPKAESLDYTSKCRKKTHWAYNSNFENMKFSNTHKFCHLIPNYPHFTALVYRERQSLVAKTLYHIDGATNGQSHQDIRECS